MKILANENIPRLAVIKLRAIEHDVLWMREFAPGSRDESVLELSITHKRILITFDKDFGELAFRKRYSGIIGIILFRQRKAHPDDLAAWIVKSLKSRDDWVGHFSVVE